LSLEKRQNAIAVVAPDLPARVRNERGCGVQVCLVDLGDVVRFELIEHLRGAAHVDVQRRRPETNARVPKRNPVITWPRNAFRVRDRVVTRGKDLVKSPDDVVLHPHDLPLRSPRRTGASSPLEGPSIVKRKFYDASAICGL
jgi:hypothetical protein